MFSGLGATQPVLVKTGSFPQIHLSASAATHTEALNRECANTMEAAFSDQYHCYVWPYTSRWLLYPSQRGWWPLTLTASWALCFCFYALILSPSFAVRQTQLEEVSKPEKKVLTGNIVWRWMTAPCSDACMETSGRVAGWTGWPRGCLYICWVVLMEST